ncbi:MAG: short-chain dehydrogenase [Polyangiaceae bacterium]|jgi:short-subunit dehydrogenase|nr:short-chain dehydrogenase [Polyangiaceae bacterium]
MSERRSPLVNQVVVITGASTGIGRASAVELARVGARVVIAGRRAETLEDTAARCREVGGQAFPVVADVTDEAQVSSLATRALELNGSVAVWVNNAGVTAFGSLEDVPLADHRRVVETNLWGAVHGARAILPIFRRQGHGVLINVGSILSKVGQPFVPSYVISKFALHGLSEALRAELADQPNIKVCTLLPYAVDTPHFQEGANLIGREPHAMPPTQSPEKVARALVDLAERPRRQLHVPRIAAWGLALHAVCPELVERVIHDTLARWHFGAPQALNSAGNLWEASAAPPSAHGQRGPRIGLAGLMGWLIGHYAARGVRAVAGV